MEQTSPIKNEPTDKENEKNIKIYEILLNIFIHNDRLYWENVNHFIILQIAILGGMYATKEKFIGGILGIAGALLVYCLLQILKKNEKDRKVNYTKMHGIEKDLDFNLTDKNSNTKATNIINKIFTVFIGINIFYGVLILLNFFNIPTSIFLK